MSHFEPLVVVDLHLHSCDGVVGEDQRSDVRRVGHSVGRLKSWHGVESVLRVGHQNHRPLVEPEVDEREESVVDGQQPQSAQVLPVGELELKKALRLR